MIHLPITDDFSTNTLTKARKELKDGMRCERDPEHGNVWWVKTYRTELGDGWTSCTCQHGMNHSPAICYHVAAAAQVASELPLEGPDEDDEEMEQPPIFVDKAGTEHKVPAPVPASRVRRGPVTTEDLQALGWNWSITDGEDEDND